MCEFEPFERAESERERESAIRNFTPPRRVILFAVVLSVVVDLWFDAFKYNKIVAR